MNWVLERDGFSSAWSCSACSVLARCFSSMKMSNSSMARNGDWTLLPIASSSARVVYERSPPDSALVSETLRLVDSKSTTT